ncbi:MAG: hypothetical protein V4606_04540 [Patescibacteria group bacterium]
MNDNYLVNSIEQTFSMVITQVIYYLPLLIAALAVIIIGWIIANALKAVIITIFSKLGINQLLDAAGIDELTKRAGYNLDAGYFAGTLVKWFVLIIAFVVALDILNLDQVSTFLQTVVLSYLPNVLVAVLILFASFIVAKFASDAVAAATQASQMKTPAILPKATYVAIIFFAILAALNQLQIAPELIQILFTGMVFALSLALGLAFGLGGRDAASRYIDKTTQQLPPRLP